MKNTERAHEGFVVNLYKESPMTSHDAVAQLRRVLGERRIGHTGTLDPFATGVLLCCVGRATKLSTYLMDLTKEYEGTILFGVKTDTGDTSGQVLRRWDVEVPPLEVLRRTAERFQGHIMQTPPMVSALKYKGKRLYQLAREGIVVERKPRKVFVESFEILGVEGGRIRFRSRCARGTYVRTLVEDFGEALGAGACVEDLCRTAIGPFRVEDSLKLSPGTTREEVLEHAIPMTEALVHLPKWKVPPFWAKRLLNGQAPPWVVLELPAEPEAGQTGALVSAAGQLLAIGRAEQRPKGTGRPWYDALELKLLRVI